MTLLRDIQNSAVDSSSPLTDLLRKCKVLAARLKHKELGTWVDQELSGYPYDTEPPNYRIIKTSSCGHFAGPFGSRGNGLPIPLVTLPDELHELATTHKFRDAVSGLSDLVARSESASNGGILEVHWPPDAVAHVSDRIYQHMNMLTAYKLIPRSSLVSILDTVRNKILSFALEIEGEDPNAGEPIPGNKLLSSEKAAHIFQTTIYGSVGALQAGNQNSADVHQNPKRPPR